MLENFLMALEIMGWGMLGIFVVTGVIIGMTIGLNKLTTKSWKKKNPKDSDQNKQ